MKRKKHRLIIEVTFSKPITEKDATRGLQLVLDERLDLQAAPVWARRDSPYIDKLQTKALSRVAASIRVKYPDIDPDFLK